MPRWALGACCAPPAGSCFLHLLADLGAEPDFFEDADCPGSVEAVLG